MKHKPGSYTNEEWLNGILTGDVKVLSEMKSAYFPGVLKHVLKNSGSEEDAKDLFQDAVIIIYKKVKTEELILDGSSFHTYLFAVCKNLWLKRLRKKHRTEVSIDSQMALKEDTSLMTLIEEREKNKFYRKKFKELGEDCQKLLRLFFKKTPMAEIARMMGYKSEGYAKKRKFTCKQKLIQLIRSDVAYKELIT